MQLPSVAIVLSALLSFGAKLGEAQNSFTESDEGGKQGIYPAVPSPPVTTKGINCEVLLRQGDPECGSRKWCDFLGWMRTGCKKQSECAQKSGADAKKCCDNAERLPFGGGVYYTAYMRACAPQYQLRRFDRPDFIELPCPAPTDCTVGKGSLLCSMRDWDSAVGLAEIDCTLGMSKGFCDMRSWEIAGCEQRAKCDKTITDVSELPSCCANQSDKPKGLFSQLYQSRFDLKCLRK